MNGGKKRREELSTRGAREFIGGMLNAEQICIKIMK